MFCFFFLGALRKYSINICNCWMALYVPDWSKRGSGVSRYKALPAWKRASSVKCAAGINVVVLNESLRSSLIILLVIVTHAQHIERDSSALSAVPLRMAINSLSKVAARLYWPFAEVIFYLPLRTCIRNLCFSAICCILHTRRAAMLQAELLGCSSSLLLFK